MTRMKNQRIVLVLCIFLSSCEIKELDFVEEPTPTVSPIPTEEGKNTFSFRKNGKVHVYAKKYSAASGFFGSPGGIELYKINRDTLTWALHIYAVDKNRLNDRLSLYLICNKDSTRFILPKTNFTYRLSKYHNYYGSSYIDYSIGEDNNDEFIADTTLSTITFTRFDSIAAGRFEFYGNNHHGQEVHLTEGQFDFSLK